MKRINILLVALTAVLTAGAQNFVNIHGTQFKVELDGETGTAAIVDYSRTVDDHKYPYGNNHRKISGLTGENAVLEVPMTINLYGRDFTVTEIGSKAFADYSNFYYVSIPPTVEKIGEYAFFNTNLRDVKVPPSVKEIGNRAFGNCKKLKHLALPTRVVLAGERVFSEAPKDLIVERTDKSAFTPSAASTLMAYGNNLPGSVSQAVSQPDPAPQPVVQAPAAEPQTLAAPAAQPVAQAAPQPKAQPQPEVKAQPMPEPQPEPEPQMLSDVDMNLPAAGGVSENTYAVIIANEEYQNDGPVTFALNDGRMFKKYCLETLGIPEKNIRVQENGTLNNMRGCLNWMERMAERAEGDAKPQFIFYYSGHGSQYDKGVAGLVPVDASLSDTDKSMALTMEELTARLGNLNAGQVCAFLDACFSGLDRSANCIVPGTRGAKHVRPVDVEKGNVVVFTACQQKETANAYDEKKHGLFTYYLLKKLQEDGGNVTLGDLSDYINKNVSDTAFDELGGKKQNPAVAPSYDLMDSWETLPLTTIKKAAPAAKSKTTTKKRKR